MPWILIIGIILCISLIQTTLLHHISVLGIQPDLFIIFLVFYSLNSNLKRSFHVNWAIGLAKDFFTEGLFGLNPILFVIVGHLISIIKDKIFGRHLITQILVTLIISIIYNLLYFFILSVSLASVDLLPTVWKCPIIAIYNSLIVSPVFWLFNRFYSSIKFPFLNRKTR
ncbi:MAG: cell shape determining protein MreD [Candidatus Scalindua rubra]|uniref:Cell shape determining protein MreD n=1 Tax=Candidatus Scalindua rubra TaxID=1872076 RepID=A0A1E3XE86_9BACT|nr:MAG: cell shape determining protein MreD [Candidatus Scalindua rubra]